MGNKNNASDNQYGYKKSFTVHDLPDAERPRERLQKMGVEVLSVPELIAAILGRGMRGDSIISITQRLMQRFRTVEDLADASFEELTEIRGIGPAKACQIKAAIELANRLNKSTTTQSKIIVNSPEEAYQELKAKFRRQKKEHFWAIFLNTQNRVIRSIVISVGSLDTSIVHPRELFKEAISASASSIIVAHNHPSGNLSASQDDIVLTKRLIETGKLTGIDVIDHIIIGDGKYSSMKREGLI